MKKKVILAPSKALAEHMLHAFNLSEEEWSAHSYGIAMCGRALDRIVVWRLEFDHPLMPNEDKMRQMLQLLRCRVNSCDDIILL